MILARPLIGALLNGTKTQHRVHVPATEPRYRTTRNRKSGSSSRTLVQPFNPQPGDRIPVRPPSTRGDNGRPKLAPVALHVTVTDTSETTLGDLSYQDARAEGHRTRADYADWWMTLNDPGWVELRDNSEDVEQVALERFALRHGGRRVRVLSVRVERHSSARYLAEGWPDYVSTPALGLRGEPEAVSEAEQAAITKQAMTRLAEWQERERRDREREAVELSIEQRVERALRAARTQVPRVDLSHEVFMLRSKMRRGASVESVLRRLVVVERKAHREVV